MVRVLECKTFARLFLFLSTNQEILCFVGHVKHFAGAMCLHWTTDNKMDYTRVSLDFRLIPAPFYHALKCGGSMPGGQKDVYRETDGYYSRCIAKGRENGTVVWEREGPLLNPDARVGFPWTVVNWEKFWKKKKRTTMGSQGSV